MKYKTFRKLVITGTMLSSVGLIVVLVRMCASGEDRPAVATPMPVKTISDTAGGAGSSPVDGQETGVGSGEETGSQGTGENGLRELDRRILERVQSGISGEKLKDAFPGDAAKVSLYRDAGHSAVNRVKIDLDRDEKWDEKWTFDGDQVKRQVAPADDDRYTDEYALAGDRWLRPGERAPEPAASASGGDTTPAAPAEGGALRAVDEQTLAAARKGIDGDKVKDAFPSLAEKVNLYRDAGQSGVNRAKIDLDRDDKWDEKWTFDGDQVKRQVAPADDENYTLEFRLREGRWVAKKR